MPASSRAEICATLSPRVNSIADRCRPNLPCNVVCSSTAISESIPRCMTLSCTSICAAGICSTLANSSASSVCIYVQPLCGIEHDKPVQQFLMRVEAHAAALALLRHQRAEQCRARSARMRRPPALPIDLEHAEFSRVEPQRLTQREQRVVDVHRTQPAGGERLFDLGIARRDSDFGERAPAYAGRRQAEPAAILRKPIQKRVGGGVIALPDIADQRRHRGQHDEEIQRHIARRGVQVQCAKDFRCHDLMQPLRGQAGEQPVVEHHRAVDHAAQRRHIGGHTLHDGVEGSGIGHIDRLGQDLAHPGSA